MAVVFLEGFDKYGPPHASPTSLMMGEWTGVGGTSSSIVAPLSSTGQALYCNTNQAFALTRVFATSYSRLVGGFRVSSPLSGGGAAGISFFDGGSYQCSVGINAGTGTIVLKNGNQAGSVVATSSASIAANTTHYIEFDITFSNTGAYQVWLDGVSVFSGTGDMTTTANNTANGFGLTGQVAGMPLTYDDIYLFDTTGATNNAVLLTQPRIETMFPTSDNAVQFSFGAGVLGSSAVRVNTFGSTIVNGFNLRKYTPLTNCTISSISFWPQATNGAVQLRPVIYADSSGVAGALMSTGPVVTGMTQAIAITLPLTTPQSLIAGTQYWVGFMNDLVLTNSVYVSDNNNLGYRATVTFASGAPGTAPALTSNVQSLSIWGNLTSGSGNFDVVNQPLNQQSVESQYAYVYDSVVNHEDLYTFNSLSQPPLAIYAVAVKALVARSDSGTRTVSARLKSGATDSGGSLTGQSPGNSFAWIGSFFPTDPNTGSAWSATALNAALSGLKIDS